VGGRGADIYCDGSKSVTATGVSDKINEMAKAIVGTVTIKGNCISSVSLHALERMEQRGVSPDDVKNTLQHPLEVLAVKFDSRKRPSQRYIGESAVVNVNPAVNKVTTVWKTSEKTRKKYGK